MSGELLTMSSAPAEKSKDVFSQIGHTGRALRVVSIAHSAFLDGSARLRYYPVAVRGDMDLTVIVPDRWSEEGQTALKGLEGGPVKIQSHRVLMHELPKVKWYLHFYPGMARCIRDLAPDVIHLWEEPWSQNKISIGVSSNPSNG